MAPRTWWMAVGYNDQGRLFYTCGHKHRHADRALACAHLHNRAISMADRFFGERLVWSVRRSDRVTLPTDRVFPVK